MKRTAYAFRIEGGFYVNFPDATHERVVDKISAIAVVKRWAEENKVSLDQLEIIWKDK